MAENSTTLTDGQCLWLWLNGDHYVAYDNPYPTADGGDPLTLGEPTCIAVFQKSVVASNRTKSAFIQGCGKISE